MSDEWTLKELKEGDIEDLTMVLKMVCGCTEHPVRAVEMNHMVVVLQVEVPVLKLSLKVVEGCLFPSVHLRAAHLGQGVCSL